MIPHSAPTPMHVCGLHIDEPHVPGVPPPPHCCPVGQLPQLSTTPSAQPSPDWPHMKPKSAHVFGVHAPAGGPTHDARSNSMNSRVFSCGVIVPAVHSFGNVEPPELASD